MARSALKNALKRIENEGVKTAPSLMLPNQTLRISLKRKKTKLIKGADRAPETTNRKKYN